MRAALFVCLMLLPAAKVLAERPPVPVFVTPTAETSHVATIEALGTLKANNAVTITATVTEQIQTLHFVDGQKVNKGDLLVTLEHSEELALVEEARLTAAEAKRQYEREKSLVKRKLTTEASLDQKRVTYQAASAKLNVARSRLQERFIKAPFSGVLGLNNLSVGALIKPGDVITTLDDVETLKLDFTVPAPLISEIKPGLTVKAFAADSQQSEYQGSVVSIDTRVNAQTRSVIVRAKVPNPNDKLKPGMLLNVLLNKPAKRQLVVPEESLVQEGYNQFVYVIADNTAEKRKINVSERRQGLVVVDQGLSVGELVVTHGILKLRSGSKVSISANDNGEALETLLKKNKK